MLRLTEAALLAAPLLMFLVWATVLRRTVTRSMLGAGVLGLLLMAATLLWFGFDRSLSPTAAYRPAHLDASGQVRDP